MTEAVKILIHASEFRARSGSLYRFPSRAQHGYHSEGRHITIDGAVTPEQITDAEAFNVWFIALAEPYDGSTEKARRLDIKLSPLGFDQADKASMIAALVSFKSEYDQIMSGRAALAAFTASAGISIDQLRASEDSLVEGTRQTLQSTLSAPAWSRVNAWVTGHVKAHTKAYIVQH